MSTLSQKQWDSYKSVFPNDKKLQALSLAELFQNTDGGKIDWDNLTGKEHDAGARTAAISIDPCALNIGYVVFDVICLAIGAVGLRAGATAETAEKVAEAAKPVMSKLETIIAKMSAEGASKTDLATGTFKILQILWSGNALGAVLSAFLGSLTWYYALLYGATALATIVAAVATDGVAFIAEVVIELATFGFLVADSINAAKACA
jgi:hypothetical protein